MVPFDTPAIWRAAAVGPEPPVRRRSQFDPKQPYASPGTEHTRTSL